MKSSSDSGHDQIRPSGTVSGFPNSSDLCIAIDDDDWGLDMPATTLNAPDTPDIQPTPTLSVEDELRADRDAIVQTLYKKSPRWVDVFPGENESLQAYFVRAHDSAKEKSLSPRTYACIGHAAALARRCSKTHWFSSITGRTMSFSDRHEMNKARSTLLAFSILDELVRNFRLPRDAGKLLFYHIRLLNRQGGGWRKDAFEAIKRYFPAHLSRDEILVRLDQLLHDMLEIWASEANKKLQAQHQAGSLVWGGSFSGKIFDREPWLRWKKGNFQPIREDSAPATIPTSTPTTTRTAYPFVNPTNQRSSIPNLSSVGGYSNHNDSANQFAPTPTYPTSIGGYNTHSEPTNQDSSVSAYQTMAGHNIAVDPTTNHNAAIPTMAGYLAQLYPTNQTAAIPTAMAGFTTPLLTHHTEPLAFWAAIQQMQGGPVQPQAPSNPDHQQPLPTQTPWIGHQNQLFWNTSSPQTQADSRTTERLQTPASTTQPSVVRPPPTTSEIIQIPDSPPASTPPVVEKFATETLQTEGENEPEESPPSPSPSLYTTLAEAILTETPPSPLPAVKSEPASAPATTQPPVSSKKGGNDTPEKGSTEAKGKQPAPAWWIQYMI